MKIDTLHKLLIHELKDLYSAEKQLVRALPKMAKAAGNEDLKASIEQHLEETKEQVNRLDQIFKMMESSNRGEKCKGMEGLLEEAQNLLEEDIEPEVLDAGMIAAAQKVEHYEIAGYGTARTYAQLLGYDEAVALLQQTLDEEKMTDEKLTMLAEQGINVAAMEEE